MNGRLVGALILGIAAVAGAGMYYLQVHAFYEPVSADAAEIRLVPIASGAPEPIVVAGFEGIDADSSPLRYRACFTTPLSLAMLTETYTIHDAPEPLTAPGWFDCFDATAIGTALERGRAVAFLSEPDVATGVDRIVAIFPDGRGYAWHQLNETYRD